MNTRTLLIIVALALPPVALAIIVQSGPTAQKNNASLNTGTPTANTEIKKGAISSEPVRLPPLEPNSANPKLDEAEKQLHGIRQRINRRLKALKQMKPDQWEAERRRNPKAPPTLGEAIERNTAMLDQLKNITAEEWAAGTRPRQLQIYHPSVGTPTMVTNPPAIDGE